MNKKSGIYQILNKVNGKVYIGQSININVRFSDHKNKLIKNCHHNKHLQDAFNKYCKDNFEFNVLEEVPTENLTVREQYWLDIKKAYNRKFGYNIAICADSPSKGRVGTMLNRRHSELSIQKMRNSHKGQVSNMKGKHHTEATKQLIREKHIGMRASVETKSKMSLHNVGMKGKKQTESAKQKMSLAKKGKPWTVAMRESRVSKIVGGK